MFSPSLAGLPSTDFKPQVFKSYPDSRVDFAISGRRDLGQATRFDYELEGGIKVKGDLFTISADCGSLQESYLVSERI